MNNRKIQKSVKQKLKGKQLRLGFLMQYPRPQNSLKKSLVGVSFVPLCNHCVSAYLMARKLTAPKCVGIHLKLD